MAESLSISPVTNSFELQERMDKRKARRGKMCEADFSFHSPSLSPCVMDELLCGLLSTWVSRGTLCCGHSTWSGMGVHDSCTWVWAHVLSGFASDSNYSTNASSSKWTSFTTDWASVISQLLPSLLPIQELFPTNMALCCTRGLSKRTMKHSKLLLCQF